MKTSQNMQEATNKLSSTVDKQLNEKKSKSAKNKNRKEKPSDTTLSITGHNGMQVSEKQIEAEIKLAKSIVQQIYQKTTTNKKLEADTQDVKKRKEPNENDCENSIVAKQVRLTNCNLALEPVQLRWRNNSCAYDVVILTLYQLWCENQSLWSKMFAQQFKDLYFFTGRFQHVFNNKFNLEKARYLWICRLHKRSPENYTMNGFTDMLELLPEVLQLKSNLITKVSTCVSCKKEVERYQCNNSW